MIEVRRRPLQYGRTGCSSHVFAVVEFSIEIIRQLIALDVLQGISQCRLNGAYVGLEATLTSWCRWNVGILLIICPINHGCCQSDSFRVVNVLVQIDFLRQSVIVDEVPSRLTQAACGTFAIAVSNLPT